MASGLAKNNLAARAPPGGEISHQGARVRRAVGPAHVINLNSNNMVITATPRLTAGGSGTVDSIGAVEKLSEIYGVSLTPPSGVTAVAYDPRGFASLTSSRTFFVARNSKTDSVTVDGLGRVTK